MNIIKAKSSEQKWNINLGGLARIWKVRLDCLSSPLAPPLCGFGYINWLCLGVYSAGLIPAIHIGTCYSHTDLTQGGCIIRAAFLDDISKAYVRNPDLPNLLVDPQFASKLASSQVRGIGRGRGTTEVCELFIPGESSTSISSPSLTRLSVSHQPLQ